MKSKPIDWAALGERTSSSVLVVWPPMATGTRSAGLFHHDLGHADALLEGHGGEIAGGAAGQQRRVFFGQARCRAGNARRCAAPPRSPAARLVAERRRHGDVAAFEPLFQALRVHNNSFSGRALTSGILRCNWLFLAFGHRSGGLVGKPPASDGFPIFDVLWGLY